MTAIMHRYTTGDIFQRVASSPLAPSDFNHVWDIDEKWTLGNFGYFLLPPPKKDVMFLVRSVCLSVHRITRKLVNGF